MIRYTFSMQAQCVATCASAAEHLQTLKGVNLSDSIECARVAETTLRSLALIGEKTVLRAQDLENAAREILVLIDRNEGDGIGDVVEIKMKLKKILGETVEGKKQELLDSFRI